ncbi:hypothetical protein [Pseudomarimonas salicorniae]|uniref:Uncharacterized protein n=1 Tax=Pseudomarimonas salicorniae TaxID=2933270 RepID=A0ABT0GEE7_9GAMM|nr:hypothetical protein [Lysobacter sp. CAU 1642]MCK7592906.1 hypothetical protein [Lysobacter sp. CAU 1642]
MAHLYTYELPDGQAVIRSLAEHDWGVAFEGNPFIGHFPSPQAALNAVRNGEAKWSGPPGTSPADRLPALLGQWSAPQ